MASDFLLEQRGEEMAGGVKAGSGTVQLEGSFSEVVLL